MEEARNFINKMACHPDVVGWATLLSSCSHGDMEIGKWVADSLIELEPQSPATYVLLSSLYAAKGKWNEVAPLRRGMRDKRVKKNRDIVGLNIKAKCMFSLLMTSQVHF